MNKHGITQCPNCDTLTSVDTRICSSCEWIVNPSTTNVMSNIAFIEQTESRIAS